MEPIKHAKIFEIFILRGDSFFRLKTQLHIKEDIGDEKQKATLGERKISEGLKLE